MHFFLCVLLLLTASCKAACTGIKLKELSLWELSTISKILLAGFTMEEESALKILMTAHKMVSNMCPIQLGELSGSPLIGFNSNCTRLAEGKRKTVQFLLFQVWSECS